MKKLLSLRPEFLPAGQWLINSPLRIYYNLQLIDEKSGKVNRVFNWEVRQSDGDYRTTNGLLAGLESVLISGRPLVGFVAYAEVFYWQFLPSYIWTTFFRAVEYTKIAVSLIEEMSPDIIRVLPAYDSNSMLWFKLMGSIAQTFKIVVKFERVNPLGFFCRPREQLKHALRRIGIPEQIRILSNAIFNLYFFCAEKFNFHRMPKKHDVNSILFASFERNWVRAQKKQEGFYDQQIYPLLSSLRDNGWNKFFGIDCPYSFKSPLKLIAERAQDKEKDVSWSGFYSFSNLLSTNLIKKKARDIFRKQWVEIETNPDFADKLQYRGVKLLPVLKDELKRAFVRILPACAQINDIAYRVLKDKSPKGLILTYETGPYQRAFITAARKLKIPSIGLMHGMIFDNHYDYMHASINADSNSKPVGFVVPEVTCVWGAFWKSNLTCRGHYPSDSIVVTGNWRYDRLVNTLKNINLEEIKDFFGVIPGKKIILIISGGMHTLAYLNNCLLSLSTVNDICLLVKIHPADDPVPVLKLLKRYGIKTNFLIKGQLTEALLIADLVISQVSTVLSEAVLLNKQVILVDFEGHRGYEEYYNLEIFFIVNDIKKLSEIIFLALKEPYPNKEISIARNRFISNYFFKNDGHSAKRVADVLRERIAHGRE